MKKLIAICAVMGLVVAVSGTAQAVPYVSTFNITQQDFSWTGFSWDHDGEPATPREPILTPSHMAITSMAGTYALNIPPAGDFLWYVYASGSISADYNEDGTWDDTQVFDKFLGNFASWGPSTSWGPSSAPFTITHAGHTFDFLLGFEVDFDGAYPSGNFGPNAFADFTFADQNSMLNTFLTAQDNLLGGGDGVIDGRMKGDFTVTAIPEPATMLLLGMGLLAGVAGLKKKKA